MSQTSPPTSASASEAGPEPTHRYTRRPLTVGRVVRWLFVLVVTVSAEVGIDAVAGQQSLRGATNAGSDSAAPADTVWVERVDTVLVERVETVWVERVDTVYVERVDGAVDVTRAPLARRDQGGTP